MRWVRYGQSPGEKKRFELTFETVRVALFTERVGQRVPDRRTSNRKGPTAECCTAFPVLR